LYELYIYSNFLLTNLLDKTLKANKGL